MKTGIEVIKWKGCGLRKPYMQILQVGCGHEESGSIMRVKLATGSCPKQKTSGTKKKFFKDVGVSIASCLSAVHVSVN